MACGGRTGGVHEDDQKTCECGHEQPFPSKVFVRRSHVGHLIYTWTARLPEGSAHGPLGHALPSERAYVRADEARQAGDIAAANARKEGVAEVLKRLRERLEPQEKEVRGAADRTNDHAACTLYGKADGLQYAMECIDALLKEEGIS